MGSDDWGKFKKGLNLLKKQLTFVRLRIAKSILPKNYFAQSLPYYISSGVKYQDYWSEGKVFARESGIHSDINRWILFKQVLEYVQILDAGDYAELGTHRGNTARLIYKNKSREANLYCFDTFGGFDERDVKEERQKSGVKTQSGHFGNTDIKIVQRFILGGALPVEDLFLREGYFPETFLGLENKKWRFVHLDADLYSPMKSGIEKFWPNIVEGGVLLIHDYSGAYKGSKLAADEFFGSRGIRPTIFQDKVGSAMYIKESNTK